MNITESQLTEVSNVIIYASDNGLNISALGSKDDSPWDAQSLSIRSTPAIGIDVLVDNATPNFLQNIKQNHIVAIYNKGKEVGAFPVESLKSERETVAHYIMAVMNVENKAAKKLGTPLTDDEKRAAKGYEEFAKFDRAKMRVEVLQEQVEATQEKLANNKQRIIAAQNELKDAKSDVADDQKALEKAKRLYESSKRTFESEHNAPRAKPAGKGGHQI